jgi:hypothetical protein
MIHFYQIGDLAFHMEHQVDASSELKSRGRATELLWSPEIARPNSQYLHESRQRTIRGTLRGNCAKNANAYLQHLKSLVGLPTDLIGYVIVDEANAPCSDCACACGMAGCGCRLLWLHNRGVINGVRLNGDDAERDYPELEITLEHDLYWEPINRYFWHWQADTYSPFKAWGTVLPYSTGLQPYPTCENLFAGCAPCRVFARKVYADADLGLDPDLHQADIANHMLNYPDIGLTRAWSAGNKAYRVQVNRDLWGAPPSSFYAFRKLPTTGSITITVQQVQGTWRAGTTSATLNLATLNASLAAKGYTGISPTDVLYLGDVEKRPGFIKRGTVKIDNPRPEIIHTGFHVGMLQPGRNEIQITVPSGAEHASVHRYRRL